MFKKEIIWREILFQATEKGIFEFQQQKIAKKFGFSLSTVFNALKSPKKIQAIKTGGNGFKLINKEKLLYLWATHRNIQKDLIYQTHVKEAPIKIEGMMPEKVTFGAYSAYRNRFGDIPSDYGQVYVYLDETDLKIIKKRFPIQKGPTNLFVLKKDAYWKQDNLPLVQIFVDIWNFNHWYTKDFLKKLEDKLNLNQ